ARRLKAARRRHGASNDLKGRPVPWLAGRFRRSIQALAAGLPDSWPGNVRELANTIERALILAEGDTIHTRHLVFGMGAAAPATIPPTLRAAERQTIVAAPAATQGHRKQAAQRLGISLRSLYNKLREYDIA
ncbi:MAG: helix-turn-helix domain-containing protein, partial [Nannocystaceae bacterium]